MTMKQFNQYLRTCLNNGYNEVVVKFDTRGIISVDPIKDIDNEKGL